MADLITVVQYKDAEGLRGEKDDDRLNVIVPQVSDLVKKYCGISFVDFYSTDKVETFCSGTLNLKGIFDFIISKPFFFFCELDITS